MSLHGEDATQAMRRCLQVCREVGRVSHQTDITNLVLLWHDGHRIVQQHICPVDGFKVFLTALAVIMKHLQHVAAQVALLGNGLQFLQFLRLMHKAIGGIPTLSYPSP